MLFKHRAFTQRLDLLYEYFRWVSVIVVYIYAHLKMEETFLQVDFSWRNGSTKAATNVSFEKYNFCLMSDN